MSYYRGGGGHGRGRGGGSSYYNYYDSERPRYQSGSSVAGPSAPPAGGFRRWGQPSTPQGSSPARRGNGGGANAAADDREEGEADDEPGQISDGQARAARDRGRNFPSSRYTGDRVRDRERTSSSNFSRDGYFHAESSTTYRDDPRERGYSERPSHDHYGERERIKRPRYDDEINNNGARTPRASTSSVPAEVASSPAARSHHSKSSHEEGIVKAGFNEKDERSEGVSANVGSGTPSSSVPPQSDERRSIDEARQAGSILPGWQSRATTTTLPTDHDGSRVPPPMSGPVDAPPAGRWKMDDSATSASGSGPPIAPASSAPAIPTGPRAGVGSSARGGFWAPPGGAFRGGFGRGRGRGRGGIFGAPPQAGHYGPGGFANGQPTTEDPPAKSLARKKDAPSTYSPNTSAPAESSVSPRHKSGFQPLQTGQIAAAGPIPESTIPEAGKPGVSAVTASGMAVAQGTGSVMQQDTEPNALGNLALPAASTVTSPASRKSSHGSRTQSIVYTAAQFSYALDPALEAQLFTISHQRLVGMRQITLSKQRRDLNAALYALQDAQSDLQAARERTRLTETMLQNASESADIFALQENKKESEAAVWAQQVMGSL